MTEPESQEQRRATSVTQQQEVPELESSQNSMPALQHDEIMPQLSQMF